MAIYGLVVFLSMARVIDDRMVILCDQMEKEAFNPAPAILAETIYSLNFGRRVKKDHLKYYTQMLYDWFLSHLNQQLLYT